MKKRSVISLLMAMAFVVATPASAMAKESSNSNNGFNPSEQSNQQIYVEFEDGQTSEQEANVPTYGYVGKDTMIIDPDPVDPDVKPGPGDPGDNNGKQIDIDVPVKLMWAAFESDHGEVSSPVYYVRNNSEELAVTVVAESFKGRNNQANDLVDAAWDLGKEGLEHTSKKLRLSPAHTFLGNPIQGISNSVVLGDKEISLGTVSRNGGRLGFEITGTLDVQKLGSELSDLELQPEYDLVLRLKAV